MKVQLIVVQGKPEGKMIPLVGPTFRIGRGETCNLRPNSEQVSREHAEFAIVGDKVTVRDLGSRNGTLVNGKAVTETWTLKDRDLVQVGPLTFAVAIEDAPVAVAVAVAATKAPSKPARAPAAANDASPDDVSHDDIEAWLVSDAKSPAPENPSGVYGGDTITIAAFKNTAPKPAAPAPAPAPTTAADDDDGIKEFDRLPEGAGDDDEAEEELDAEAPTEAIPEEFVDESNPFHKKKKGPEAAAPAKPGFKDTSDAASEILRKMMERRRGSK